MGERAVCEQTVAVRTDLASIAHRSPHDVGASPPHFVGRCTAGSRGSANSGSTRQGHYGARNEECETTPRRVRNHWASLLVAYAEPLSVISEPGRKG